MEAVLVKDNRSEPMKYGEAKRKKTILLTPTASEALEQLAEKTKLTQSDFLEQVIRQMSERPEIVAAIFEGGTND